MPAPKKEKKSLKAAMAKAAKPTTVHEYTIAHPLHVAIVERNIDRVKELILKESDLEIQDPHGWTALHHAVWIGDRKMIELIIDLGAFAHPITGCGKFPREIAQERGHAHLDDLLDKLDALKKPSCILGEWLDNPQAFIHKAPKP